MDVRSLGKEGIRPERGTTRVVQASKKIREKRLKWYGVVMRMKDEHMVRRMLDVNIKRRRRMPNLRLKDARKRVMTEAGLKEDNTTNRAEWRNKIKTPDDGTSHGQRISKDVSIAYLEAVEYALIADVGDVLRVDEGDVMR